MLYHVATSIFALGFLVLSFSSTARGFWIITHHSLVSQRLDPILTNGTSGHTHAFVGSAAILPSQDANSLCTTSKVKADKSNYWAPQMYYYHSTNKTFDAVPLSYVQTYYLNRGGPKTQLAPGVLKAFPKGLKMIAGNATAMHSPDPDSTKAKAVSFVCLSENGGNQTTTLPEGPCPWGLRTQIVFPSCWDGKNLDSKDHQSHVSYPLGGSPDSGDCPKSHPVKFTTLFYEFVWSTEQLRRRTHSGFVLANGDAIGHSFHADFVADWDTQVLQNAIDQCTGNLFGDLKSCAPFVPTLREESNSTGKAGPKMSSRYCTTKESVKEQVLGKGLKSLPGCNKVQNGRFKGAGKTCTASKTLTIQAAVGGPDDAAGNKRSEVEGDEGEEGAEQQIRSAGSSQDIGDVAVRHGAKLRRRHDRSSH